MRRGSRPQRGREIHPDAFGDGSDPVQGSDQFRQQIVAASSSAARVQPQSLTLVPETRGIFGPLTVSGIPRSRYVI